MYFCFQLTSDDIPNAERLVNCLSTGSLQFSVLHSSWASEPDPLKLSIESEEAQALPMMSSKVNSNIEETLCSSEWVLLIFLISGWSRKKEGTAYLQSLCIYACGQLVCIWKAFLTLIGLVTLSYSNCLVLEQPTEEVLTVKMLLSLPTLFTILGLGYQIYYNHDLRARTRHWTLLLLLRLYLITLPTFPDHMLGWTNQLLALVWFWD